jgi:pyrimidine deaminase RibD-like protein
MSNDNEESPTADHEFARLAVDKAKLCPVKAGIQNPPPRVGIVIAKDNALLGWVAKGHGGETAIDGNRVWFPVALNQHAEEALLEKLQAIDLSGATAFVTLEPCTRRKNGRSCAERILESGIKVVHVGNCDPNPDVGALAWAIFHKHGIVVRDFPAELRNEALRDNAAFFDKFRWSTKESGNAAFDYEANGGKRVLGLSDREFTTTWTNRGRGSIYALDYQNNVCVAKNCSDFDQIDDPGRWFEDSHYTKPVNEGEIVIFKNEHGFALVQIREVMPKESGRNAELKFAYQLRYLKR